jgi:hypothetical protein
VYTPSDSLRIKYLWLDLQPFLHPTYLSLYLASFRAAFINTDLLLVPDSLIDVLLNDNTLQFKAAQHSHHQQNPPALL